MHILFQESELELVNDKLQEIVELSRGVMTGKRNARDEIEAAFAISIKAHGIQELLTRKGTIKEVEQCLVN